MSSFIERGRNFPQIEHEDEVEDDFDEENDGGEPLEKRPNTGPDGAKEASTATAEKEAGSQHDEEAGNHEHQTLPSETREQFMAAIDSIQQKLAAKRARDEQVLCDYKALLTKMVEDHVDNMAAELGNIHSTFTTNLEAASLDAQTYLDRIAAHEEDLAHFKNTVGGYISKISLI